MHNRVELRQNYFTAWAKYHKQAHLDGIELQIVEVLKQHPEYHAFFSDESNLHTEHPPQELWKNPYLHCGLHMALIDQIKNDLPPGIRDAYQTVVLKHNGDVHAAEHAILELLAEVLWEMQRTGQPPSMEGYLLQIRKI